MDAITACFLLNMTKNAIAVMCLAFAGISQEAKGYFVLAAVLIFLFGGVSLKQSPSVCPNCGQTITEVPKEGVK